MLIPIYCFGVLSIVASGGGGEDDDDDSSSSSSAGPAYSVSGTVNGLSGGSVVLRMNGSINVTVSTSGNFTFGTNLSSGTSYAVGVLSSPNAQVCSVASGGNGTIASANITNVVVNCAGYSVGGTVTGLTGSGLTLQLNNANDLTVGTSSFTFPSGSLAGIAVYTVSIKTQPTGQTCIITNPRGFVTAAVNTITSPTVKCFANVTSPLSGTYQAAFTNVVFTGRAFITFYTDGTYIMALHSAQPECSANSGNGLEYGVYNWNSTTHAFNFINVAVDTNGDCGFADGTAYSNGTLIKNSNGTLSTDTLDTDGSGAHIIVTWTPVTSTTGTLIGSWGNNQYFTVYASNGTFFNAVSMGVTQNSVVASAGIEDGCYLLSGSTTSGSYTFNIGATCALNATLTAVDTNGVAYGLSALGTAALNFSVSGDTLQNWVGTNTPGTATRIVTN
ncbi:MAG: hypothetical protein QM808_06830 [Steroidobacteraceae bacterium]